MLAGSSPGMADLLTVLAHEMGHLRGVRHDASSEGVMAERLTGGERNLDRYARSLDGAALDAVFAAYAVGEGTIE